MKWATLLVIRFFRNAYNERFIFVFIYNVMLFSAIYSIALIEL